MEIKSAYSKQTFRLRAGMACATLMAFILLTSLAAGRMQPAVAAPATLPLSAPAAADPDLCALLPSGAAWIISSSDHTQGCRAVNNGDSSGSYKDVKQVDITRYASPAEAQSQLKAKFTAATANGFGRWDVTDQYGDSGFGYDIIPINLSDPGGAFTRGSYLVIATANRGTGMDDPGNVHALLKTIDAALRGAGTTEQNPDALLLTFAGANSPCANKTTQAGVFYIQRGPAKQKDRDPGTGALIRRDAPVFFQTDDGTERVISTASFSTRIPPTGTLYYGSFGLDERNALPLFYGTEIRIPGLAKLYDDRWYITVELGPNEQYQIGPDGYLKLGCTPTEAVKVGRGAFQALVKGSDSPAATPLHKIETENAVITPMGGGHLYNALAPVNQAGGIGIRIGINASDPARTGVTIYAGSAQVAPKSGGTGVTISVGQHVDVNQGSVSPPTNVVEVPGTDNQTFPETGKAATGIFMDYWQTHGNLAQQGYPISGLLREKSDLNGQTYTVQYFERAVFEFHTEFSPPNDVLLSQLGTFQYKRKYPTGAPNQQPNTSAGSRLFTETGHQVGGKFLDYWNTHGSLAQQGLPLSDEFTEVSETDGKTYTVQYFERAVFELHTELAPPNDVLLSLLGNFFYKQKYGGGTPPPPPPPGATPTTTSGGGGNCSTTTNIAAASNGASIAGASSDFGPGWKPDRVIDGDLNTGWASAQGTSANEYVIVALPGGKTYNVNKVRINPWNSAPSCCPNDGIKDFEIRVSTTDANPSSFTKVYAGTTPNQNAFFDFTFSPVQAKYVMLFAVRNYGGGWVEAKEFEVYQDCSGGNPPPVAPTPTPGSNPPPVVPTPTTTSGGGGQCSDIPPSQNVTVTPSNCARAGSTFIFEATGFNPGESVGVYATGPDGQVIGANFQVTADSTGAIRDPNAISLSTQPTSPQGIYALTMEGVTSHRRAIGYIKLLAP